MVCSQNVSQNLVIPEIIHTTYPISGNTVTLSIMNSNTLFELVDETPWPIELILGGNF